jgi:alpha-L-rhamnosidase
MKKTILKGILWVLLAFAGFIFRFRKHSYFMLSIIFCFFSITSGFAYQPHPTISLKKLSVEMMASPAGIDISQPRLSWQIITDVSNIKQVAYQVIVADSKENLKKGKGLVWNSGKVNSNNSVLIPYTGEKLKSRQTYFWKVKIWTNKGETSWAYSEWTMAFLEPGDWKATWIGLDSMTNLGEKLNDSIHTRLAARYLRKEFETEAGIKNARIYICGLGLYECFINGEKVGNDVFAPTATEYTKRVNYNVYDVKNLLTSKNNTIGVILGNGRFVSMRFNWDKKWGVPSITHYGFPKLICQLEVEYNNGKKSIIVSDTSWMLSAKGPILANNEYDGEEYNANLEFDGWLQNGFVYDNLKWGNAGAVQAPEGTLLAQPNHNIRIMKEIKPIGIKEQQKGQFILDMGQNMVGYLSVYLKGQKDKPVKMRFAETLKTDGTLYLDNIRGALVTDIYTPSKNGIFSWQPMFTYHGFRYVEITGINYMPAVDDFVGKVIYDKLDKSGSFESSDTVLNTVYQNAWWGLAGNYRSFPTDCPQRDERMGWLGDRAMGCFGESFMFDLGLFYEKWMQDIEDCQKETGSIPDQAPTYWTVFSQDISDNVTWPSTFIFIPQMLYEQYGDIKPIIKHYDKMRLWVVYMRDKYLKDGIMPRDMYGDWCMPPENLQIIFSKDPQRITSKEIIGTTFFYRVLTQMAAYSELLGKENDKQEYLLLAEQMKNAYNNTYFNKEKAQYDNNTVTANIISLMQGLVPGGYEQKVFKGLSQRTEEDFKSHVSVGLIGIQFLMRGLTQYGRGDLAYKIATNTTYPSWGYMAVNGATTIWELWNGNTADPAMNSGNHLMLLGDLISWYYEDLAGIKTDKINVGFKKIIMKPYFPDGLSFVKAFHQSPYGEIKSEWQKNDTSLTWDISIPCNSSAMVSIPATSVNQVKVNNQNIESIEGIKSIGLENGFVNMELPSGNYSFITKK